MAYTKQNFEDGQVLTAEHLNNMEQGIEKAHSFVKTEGGDTLTWDGNTEGLTCVADVFYKVSGAIVTSDVLANGCTCCLGGTTVDSGIEEWASGIVAVNVDGGNAIFVTEEGVGVDLDGLVFSEVGVYLTSVEGFYISSLTIPGYTGFTKETLDPAYLPEHTHSWNELADKPFGEVLVEIVPLSDARFVYSADDGGAIATFSTAVSLGAGDEMTVTWDGTEYACTVVQPGPLLFGNAGVWGLGDDTGEPFLAVVGDGALTVFDLTVQEDVVRSVGISAASTKRLDAKYVDNTFVVHTATDSNGVSRLATAMGGTTYITFDEVNNALESGKTLVVKGSYMTTIQIAEIEKGSADGSVYWYRVCVIHVNHNDLSLSVAPYYTAEYTGE